MFSVPFLGWIVESEDYSLCSIPMVLQVFSATILPTEDLQGWNYLSKGCRWCTFHRHSSRWTGARCDYQEYRRLGWQRCWVLTFFPQSFFFFWGGDWLNVTWRVFFSLGVVSSRFLLFGSTNLRQNTIEEEKENTWKHLILFQEEVVNNGLREFFFILPGLTLESHSSWISGGQWGKWSTWVETVPGAPPENVGTKECPCTSSMMRTWETWEQHLEGLEIGRRSHGYIQYRLVQ